MLAFIREPLAGRFPGQLKNEAAGSCLKSITTTSCTNFFCCKTHCAKENIWNRGPEIKASRISAFTKLHLNKLLMLQIISACLILKTTMKYLILTH